MFILRSRDLTDEMLEDLFDIADGLRRVGLPKSLSGKIMATVFMEPSTRTRLSFESAMIRLGGSVISSPEPNGSSVAKGESINDTIMTVAQYADVVVVRTSEPVSQWGVLADCPAHIINAGDGSNEHPTQALLDAYTIQRHQGHKTGLNIGIMGDFSKSRTINSFVQLMSRNEKNKFYLLDATGRKPGCCLTSTSYVECDDKTFAESLPLLNVLYTGRIQQERHEQPQWQGFCLEQKHLDLLPPDAIVMNPGPRQKELPASLDDDPKVVFFEQVKNGLFVRMALLKYLFSSQS